MTPEETRILEKLLDNQKELIAAINRVSTEGQMEALGAISETQFIITQCIAPVSVEISGTSDGGPVTLQ